MVSHRPTRYAHSLCSAHFLLFASAAELKCSVRIGPKAAETKAVSIHPLHGHFRWNEEFVLFVRFACALLRSLMSSAVGDEDQRVDIEVIQFLLGESRTLLKR